MRKPSLVYLADLRYRLNPKEGGNVHIRAMRQAFAERYAVSEPPCAAGLALLRRAAAREGGALKRLLIALGLGVGALEKLAFLLRERPRLVYVRHELSDVPVVALAPLLGLRVVLEVNAVVTAERAFVGRPSRAARLKEAAERLAFRRAGGIATVSGYVAEQVLAMGADAARVIVTHNGVHAAEFPEAPAGTENGAAPVVGFVGTNHPWHRLPLVVAAFMRAAEAFPAARLRIVGPLSPDLEAAIASTPWPERVEVTGHVPRAEALAAIRGFDVAVVPTAAPHGSPLKLFEFMALARAIAAAATPAIAEVIRDGETGLLFHVDDEAALAAAFERLLGDRALRERLGEAARRSVLEAFTWEENARRVAEAFDAGPPPEGARAGA